MMIINCPKCGETLEIKISITGIGEEDMKKTYVQLGENIKGFIKGLEKKKDV